MATKQEDMTVLDLLREMEFTPNEYGDAFDFGSVRMFQHCEDEWTLVKFTEGKARLICWEIKLDLNVPTQIIKTVIVAAMEE